MAKRGIETIPPEEIPQHAKDFSRKTPEEITELKRKQCSKCFFYAQGPGDKTYMNGTCDYILITGKARMCNPFECKQKGFFTPIKGNKTRPKVKFSLT